MAIAPKSSPRKSKQTITIIIIVACIAAIVGVKFSIDSSRNHMAKMKTGRVKGDVNAPVKIVEYIDFQCPACAAGAKMLKEYMEQHPGKIFLEMKYYPLAMHSQAFTSAYYAECALQQGKFWEYHDLLIGRQAIWSVSPDVKSIFNEMAQEIGLNKSELDVCLISEKTKQTILKTRQEGDLLGVKSTPTYLINDKMVVGSKNLQPELDVLIGNKETK
jgi:protein-disulfide isomerase